MMRSLPARIGTWTWSGVAWSLVVAVMLLGGASRPAAARKAAVADERPALSEEQVTLAKAKALFKSGQKHYDLGEYKEALVDFKEAYRLKDDPSFLYNIAQSARQLGDYTEAADRYRSFLRKHNPSNRAEVEGLITEMDQKAAAKARADKVAQGSAAAGRSPTPAPAASVVAVPEPAPTPPPEQKRSRTWLWATIGVVAGVVVLGAVGIGLGVGLSGGGPADPKSALGTYGVAFQ